MERRKPRPPNRDPFIQRLREMSGAELVRFLLELTSISPPAPRRKADTRLVAKEILRRIHHNYCPARKMRKAMTPHTKAMA